MVLTVGSLTWKPVSSARREKTWTSVGLYAAAWSYQNSTLIPNDQQPALPITYPVYNDYLKNDEMLWIGKTSGAYTGDLSAGIGANLNGEERTAPLADGMDSLTLAVLAVSAQGARQTLAEASTVTASIPPR